MLTISRIFNLSPAIEKVEVTRPEGDDPAALWYAVAERRGDTPLSASAEDYQTALDKLHSLVEAYLPRVRVKCVYFKDSGKTYTSGEEEYPSSYFEGCNYPRDYGKRLIERQALPGLQAGTWAGHFAIKVKRPRDKSGWSHQELCVYKQPGEERQAVTHAELLPSVLEAVNQARRWADKISGPVLLAALLEQCADARILAEQLEDDPVVSVEDVVEAGRQDKATVR